MLQNSLHNGYFGAFGGGMAWAIWLGYMVYQSPKRLVHNLLMQFFTLGSSKMKVFET